MIVQRVQKNSSRNKIPKLRFPGFSEEWKEKKLGEVADVIGGGTPDTTKLEYWDGKINWFTPTEIKEKYISESKRKITELGLKKSSTRLLPKGALLLTSRATIGDVSIAKFRCSTNQGFQSVVVNDKNDNEFIYYWILNNKNEFIRRANGSTFLEISGRTIRKIKIFIPSLSEQQKIAGFLGAVDEWIENLKGQKEELEKYKKGIMQKIFSQEIRFKPARTTKLGGDNNGKDFPEWEEKRLGDVCKKESSNISANVLGNNVGDYKIYGANGVFKKIDFFQQEDEYISIVKDGAGVGRVFLCESKTSVLGTMDIIKPKEQINLFFLYLLLQRIKFIRYVTGSTIPHIYFKDYSKLKIKIPSLPEQQKIASFLSAIDKKIELVDAQIQKMQEWKRGLMQRVFV